jgi:hypothetical protein
MEGIDTDPWCCLMNFERKINAIPQTFVILIDTLSTRGENSARRQAQGL